MRLVVNNDISFIDKSAVVASHEYLTRGNLFGCSQSYLFAYVISISPFFQAIAMRLFKRQSSDTSPQLVSATPLSQDGTAPLTVAEENFGRSSKKLHKENDGSGRMSMKEDDSESPFLKPSSSEFCVSNRKGND